MRSRPPACRSSPRRRKALLTRRLAVASLSAAAVRRCGLAALSVEPRPSAVSAGVVARFDERSIFRCEQLTQHPEDSGLQRWTGRGRVGAIYAAVTGFRRQHRTATLATVETLTCGCRHRFGLGSTALRTDDRRLMNHRPFRRGRRELSSRHVRPRLVGRRWCRHATRQAPAMTGGTGMNERGSLQRGFPAPKWSRAIANVTRNERVPAYSPAGAAKLRPKQALVFSG